jgi:hypothetical protein
VPAKDNGVFLPTRPKAEARLFYLLSALGHLRFAICHWPLAIGHWLFPQRPPSPPSAGSPEAKGLSYTSEGQRPGTNAPKSPHAL